MGAVYAMRYDEAVRADLTIGPWLEKDAESRTPHYDALIEELSDPLEVEPQVSSIEAVQAWAAQAGAVIGRRL